MPVNRQASGTLMLIGSIASGDDGGGAGDLKGMKALSLDSGDGTAGRGGAPSCSIIRICAAPFHTTFVRQCLFFYARLSQLGPVDALCCHRTAQHTEVSPHVLGRWRSAEGHRLLPRGPFDRSPRHGLSASNSRAADPPLASFSSVILVFGEGADAHLEKWQIAVTLRKRSSGVVGLAARKVAEKRYAPVRKVCDYEMWVRCEASRPEIFGPVRFRSRGATDRFGVESRHSPE